MRSREAIRALAEGKVAYHIYSVRLLAQDTLDLLKAADSLEASFVQMGFDADDLAAKVARLEAENARLRGLVEDGWRQGWRCGYSVCCANLDPTTQQMDADWKASPVKAAIGGEP